MPGPPGLRGSAGPQGPALATAGSRFDFFAPGANPALAPRQSFYSPALNTGLGKQAPITVWVSSSSINIQPFPVIVDAGLAVTVYDITDNGDFRIGVTNVGQQPISRITVSWIALDV
jgi:hypothetical protein